MGLCYTHTYLDLGVSGQVCDQGTHLLVNRGTLAQRQAHL